MAKKHRKNKLSKHHCFPKRDKRHYDEIKVIDNIAHQRWHNLVSDRKPEEAVRYIARNFMPKNIEQKLLEAIR